MLARGRHRRADLGEILTKWLEKQLLADQYARLEQAGHSAEGKIPLARVFIDIPALTTPAGQVDESAPGFVSQMLQVAPQPLRPQASASEDPMRRRLLRARDQTPAARSVLIGGPGQGKSTISQYLCQIYRAAALSPRADRLSAAGRSVLRAVEAQCAQDQLGAPASFGFPLRIELGELAAWVVKGGIEPAQALLRYLGHQIQRATGEDVPYEDLRAFLVDCPWLLVLDGLDEVPVSAGRGLMLAAIRAFREDLASTEARGAFLATTRPQGYTGEFADFEVRWLSSLSRERALEYARRLVAVRYWDQEARREKILERLTLASQEETTARLMQSPLQVTILTALVDRVGKPPEQRWRLFSDYYRILWEREVERPIPAAEVLRTQRTHIDAIHRHVGLLLQVESERSGGSEALMPRARLEEVIAARLAKERVAEDRRAELTQSILDAATERLVFLVSPQDGKFGFELRSLQEFMAAEALMSGRDAVIPERLLAIAKAESWRNVLLFAVSKCFAVADIEHHRDTIVSVCQQLNEDAEDDVARRALAGSRLALEILREGSVRHHPEYARKLVELALRLMELPPSWIQSELGKVLGGGEAEELAKQALADRLSYEQFTERLGAWVTLSALADQGMPWAMDLGEQRWPEQGQERRDIIRALAMGAGLGSWGQERIVQHLESHLPASLPPYEAFAIHRSGSTPVWLKALAEWKSQWWRMRHNLEVTLMDDLEHTPCHLIFESIDSVPGENWATLMGVPDPPSGWRPFVAAARFLTQPSASMLAQCLEYVAAAYDPPSAAFASVYVPWPLGACLALSSTPDELVTLSQRAAAGELGDVADWKQTEERWAESGVQFEELVQATDATWPLGANIAMVMLSHLDVGIDVSLVGRLADAIARAASRAAKVYFSSWSIEALSWLLDNNGEGSGALSLLSPVHVKCLIGESPRDMMFPLASLPAIASSGYSGRDWLEMINSIGSERRYYIGNTETISTLVTYLSRLWEESPDYNGILNMLTHLASAGANANLPQHLLMPGRFKDPAAGAAAALLRLSQGFVSSADVEETARYVATVASSHPELIQNALAVPAHHALDPEVEGGFVSSLHAHVPTEQWELRAEIMDALTAFLKRRPTRLDDATTWDSLQLPLPRPAAPSATPSDLGPMPGIVRLSSIALTNLRAFDTLTLNPSPRQEDKRGQWIVLLGENGMGKSTILRGIVFALASAGIPDALLSTSTVPFRRNGADSADIQITCGAHAFRALIKAKSDREIAEAAGSEGARYPFLFAYGSRRGSALGGAQREVSFTPFAEVATLFSESEGLIHAETWLQGLRLGAVLEEKERPNGPKMATFDAVIGALKSVLLGVDIDVQEDHAWFSGSTIGERVPLAALSDGYLTTLGWVIDLIARWMHRSKQLGNPVEGDFMKAMEGLVLVDELDLHLHPRWQVRAIDDLRATFPRLSFVVTTHNPLTLLGAQEGEIFVLRRASEDGNQIVTQQIDLPKGLRADQVLTGPWFGLASTLDEDTLGLLERHRQLLRSETPASDEGRLAVEAKLRERLGGFADTSLERLSMRIAAELMDETSRDMTPEQRSGLRDKVKALAMKRRGEARG